MYGCLLLVPASKARSGWVRLLKGLRVKGSGKNFDSGVYEVLVVLKFKMGRFGAISKFQ